MQTERLELQQAMADEQARVQRLVADERAAMADERSQIQQFMADERDDNVQRTDANSAVYGR